MIDDWCPLVNLFEHGQAAAAWAWRHGISGAARPVAQATRVGAVAWQAYLWPGPRPPAALQVTRRRPPVRRTSRSSAG